MLVDDFLPYALPDIGREEIQSVELALRSNWLTSGPLVKQFEREFSEVIGGGVHAVALNSATAGLHLALESLGIGPGDEVITTTHTFTATAEVVRYLGADVKFVDINLATLCIDTSAVEQAIGPKTKAIIPVHFGGLAAEMSVIIEIARKHKISVIEDAAHAFPTTYLGDTIGSLDTNATVFSFYANKTMTTGEGGMLVTRDEALAIRAKQMRLHGISRDAFDRFRSKKPSWYYEVIAPGFKYNMTDLAAAIGLEQLKKVGRFRERREAIAHMYYEELAGAPIVLPPKPRPSDIHSWHLFVIQLRDHAKISRDSFIEAMHSNGVGCSVHYLPLHNHPYWKNLYDLEPEMFPISQRVYDASVSLPIYSKMSDDNVFNVIKNVKNVLKIR